MKLRGGRFLWLLFCTLTVFLLFFGRAQAAEPSLIISEIDYHPAKVEGLVFDENDYEWFELFNPGNIDLTISGWTVKDNLTGRLLPDLTINSKDYAVVAANKSAFMAAFPVSTALIVEIGGGKIGNGLANSGDELSLFDANKVLINKVTWHKDFGVGVSIGLVPESNNLLDDSLDVGWQKTSHVTPGLANLFAVAAPISVGDDVAEIPIAEAKKVSDDQTVSVTGTASVAPGVLSNQYFYIQDSSGGIQIYNYNKEFPEIKEGNVVEVSGTITSTHKEKRLKTSSGHDIAVLNSAIQPLVPNPISSLPETQDITGTLVSVTGTVFKNDGSSVYIKLNDDQIKIYIIDLTGIKKPRLKKGDQLEVWGILSYYDDYFRLLPRYQTDIRLISQEKTLPNSGSGMELPLIISVLLTLMIFIYSVYQHRLSS